MKLNDMIEWQWSGYASFHQSRKNLIIHIVFVPMFIISFISFTRSLLGLELVSALSSLVIMALSFWSTRFRTPSRSQSGSAIYRVQKCRRSYLT